MATKTSPRTTTKARSLSASVREISPEQRENMIREAAYFRYLERGSAPGNDLEDWFAAEAQLFGSAAEPQAPEPDETAVLGMQEGGPHGFWEDDALKRIVKQHPRKDIPRVESIEPRQAPAKE